MQESDPPVPPGSHRKSLDSMTGTAERREPDFPRSTKKPDRGGQDEAFEHHRHTFPRSTEFDDLLTLDAWIDRLEHEHEILSQNQSDLMRMFFSAGIGIAFSGVVLVANQSLTGSGTPWPGPVSIVAGLVLMVIVGITTSGDSKMVDRMGEQLLRYKQRRRELARASDSHVGPAPIEETMGGAQ